MKRIETARHGWLTVLGDAPGWKRNRQVYALCRCGSVKTYLLKNLRSGGTKSCGCYRKARALLGVKNERAYGKLAA